MHLFRLSNCSSRSLQEAELLGTRDPCSHENSGGGGWTDRTTVLRQTFHSSSVCLCLQNPIRHRKRKTGALSTVDNRRNVTSTIWHIFGVCVSVLMCVWLCMSEFSSLCLIIYIFSLSIFLNLITLTLFSHFVFLLASMYPILCVRLIVTLCVCSWRYNLLRLSMTYNDWPRILHRWRATVLYSDWRHFLGPYSYLRAIVVD